MHIVVLTLFVAGAAPPITAAAQSPDGAQIVVGSQNGLEVLSSSNLKVLRTLKTSLEHIHDLSFSPSGKTLAVVGGSPAEGGEFELRDWPAGDVILRKSPHDDLITAVAWSPDGKTFATASEDTTVKLHNADGTAAGVLEGHSKGVTGVAFLPDNNTLVSCSHDASIRVWNVETKTLIRTFNNHTAPVHGVALRPSAEGLPMIASISADRTVRLWQPTIGRMVRFARLPAAPLSVAWLPSGERLAVGSDDGKVRIIDPHTIEVVQETTAIDGWVYTLVAGENGVFAGGESSQMKTIRVEPNDD